MAEKKANGAYQQLKKDIAAGTLGTVYIFHGEETYLREYYLDQTVKKLVTAGMEEFNYHKLEGKENSRFVLLNHMGKAFEEKYEEALKNAMEEYLKKAAVLSELFPTV